MIDRRKFLRMSGAMGLILGHPALMGGTFESALDAYGRSVNLTILHTNDVHSRIDPFPLDGGRNEGRGGAAKRAALIHNIRKQQKNVLLFDCGDMFQGTPYFNVFHGELEVRLMSEMGYDAATIGNHDFDGGIENLQRQIQKHASFPLLNANYNVSNTPLHDVVQAYQVFEKDGLKIGVFGLGVELNGLVPKALIGDTRYLDPIKKANQTAAFLKNEKGCHLVVCLSHLGFHYKEEKVSDIALAIQSEHIDMILGGHTHTFMDKPYIQTNSDGKPILVSQVGWAGMVLGRIDIVFDRKSQQICFNCKNIPVNQMG